MVGWLVWIKSILALLLIESLWTHKPLSLQPTQGAIDCCEIQRRVTLMRMAVDLLSSWMAGKRLDGLQYEPAL